MDERQARGIAAYASQLGLPPDEVEAWFEDRMGERFGREAINAAAGAWVDDCLSLRDRSLLVVAALVTQGAVDERLRGHVRWAVEHGIWVVTDEIYEHLVYGDAQHVSMPGAGRSSTARTGRSSKRS